MTSIPPPHDLPAHAMYLTARQAAAGPEQESLDTCWSTAEKATRRPWPRQDWDHGRTLLGSALIAAHVHRLVADRRDETWTDELTAALAHLDWATEADDENYTRQRDGRALMRLSTELDSQPLLLIGKYLSADTATIGPCSGWLVRSVIGAGDPELVDPHVLSIAWHAVYGIQVLRILGSRIQYRPGRPTLKEAGARQRVAASARACHAAGIAKSTIAAAAITTRTTLDTWLHPPHPQP